MKKEFKFTPNDCFAKSFFSPVRRKKDVIKILMKATGYMLIAHEVGVSSGSYEMILRVDKMSRLFFFSTDKYYSINFPFTVTDSAAGLIFYFGGLVIDARIISKVNEVFKSDQFDSQPFVEFADLVVCGDNECDSMFWQVIKKLLIMEDGYVRFDHDPVTNEKFKEKGESRKHPVNHYDIFYSQSNTFKIGVNEKSSNSDLIDLLDIFTDCNFLT